MTTPRSPSAPARPPDGRPAPGAADPGTARPRVGCDVVAVARVADALARDGFADRVFTTRELADARRGGLEADDPVVHERLAARFAAKEAARKALGELDRAPISTEVRTRPDGAPRLWVDGRPAGLAVSLSHDAGVAMAVVVGSGDD